MAVCSRCNVTVSGADAQVDGQGNLLCRACAGTSRDFASPSIASDIYRRQPVDPGPWRLFGLASAAAAVFLLVVTVSMALGRSGLRKEVADLTAGKANLARDLAAARAEVERVHGELARAEARSPQPEGEARNAHPRPAAPPADGDKARRPPARPAPPAADPAAPARPASTALLAWKKSATRYHRAGCRLLAGHEAAPVTKAEIRKRALKRCPDCSPPAP